MLDSVQVYLQAYNSVGSGGVGGSLTYFFYFAGSSEAYLGAHED